MNQAESTTPLLNIFEQAVRGQSPDALSEYFLYVIVGSLVLASLASIPRWLGQIVIPATPAFLTSLGILGTFAGIFAGLLDFDFTSSETIDKSLPRLLDGLQTAFVTSIAGIVCSLIFRVTAAPLARMVHERRSQRSDDPLDNLVAATEKQTAEMLALREVTDRIAGDLALTRSLISGEGDTSVVNQMMRIRTEIRDNVREVRDDLGKMNQGFTSFGRDIRQEIRDFAAKVSEISSRELIKALEDVIRDFNSKLTEQFGENFKRLDDSVGKLLIWQENYRVHLEELKAEFEAAKRGIVDAQQAIEAIRRDTEAIPQTMQGLRDLFIRLDTQISELDRHLDAFAVMRDRASSAVPELKQHLERVFENVAGSVDQSQRHFQELQTRTRQLLDGFSAESDALEKRLTIMLNERIEAVGTRLEQTAATMEERQAAAQGALERSAANLESGANVVMTRWQQLLADTSVAAAQVGTGLENAVGSAAETLRSQLERTFEDTRKAIDASLASLDSEAKRIGGGLESSMARAATTLDQELNASFDRMRTSVTGSVEKLNAETETVAARYRETGAVIERAGVEVANQGKALTQEWAKVLKAAEQSLGDYAKSFDEELRSTSAGLNQRLEDSLKQERARIQDLANGMREEARSAAEERTSILNAELRNLDEAMQKELTRALQQMGEQLARITRKFVDDYEQLVARMEQALRTVERLEKPKS